MTQRKKSLARKKQIKVIAAILGIIVASIAIASAIHGLEKYYDAEQIRNIIEKEASLVSTGYPQNAITLYTIDATVIDAGAGNKNSEVVWSGITEINERYRTLPEFTILHHNDIQIDVNDDLIHAAASADTVGTYLQDGNSVAIHSNQGEKWTFQKIDGVWLITSFTYNLP